MTVVDTLRTTVQETRKAVLAGTGSPAANPGYAALGALDLAVERTRAQLKDLPTRSDLRAAQDKATTKVATQVATQVAAVPALVKTAPETLPVLATTVTATLTAKVTERVAALRAQLKDLPTQDQVRAQVRDFATTVKGLRGEVEDRVTGSLVTGLEAGRAKGAAAGVTAATRVAGLPTVYTDLSARGQRVVASLRRQPVTAETLAEGKAALQKAARAAKDAALASPLAPALVVAGVTATPAPAAKAPAAKAPAKKAPAKKAAAKKTAATPATKPAARKATKAPASKPAAKPASKPAVKAPVAPTAAATTATEAPTGPVATPLAADLAVDLGTATAQA